MFKEGSKVPTSIKRKVKKDIINIIASLDMELTNDNHIRSRRDFNLYRVSYDKLYSGAQQMLDYVQIETIFPYRPYPTTQLDVSNYIMKYLE